LFAFKAFGGHVGIILSFRISRIFQFFNDAIKLIMLISYKKKISDRMKKCVFNGIYPKALRILISFQSRKNFHAWHGWFSVWEGMF
jgi:hypothetical protein